MSSQEIANGEGQVLFPDPPVARLLFGTTKMAWLWLVLRLLLGYNWLSAGWGKVANPAWSETGEALKGFWTAALQAADQGPSPIAYDWYRSFINFMLVNEWYTWFAKLIAYGEVIIGIALILGAFTGIAAFLGGFLNWDFILAGTVGPNALLFVLAVILMLAWKVAGWYGLDRWLLPRIGVPWTSSSPRKTTGAASAEGQREIPAAPPAPPPVLTTPGQSAQEGAVQLLAILQRQGRLVDFLQENLDAYKDDQIGAAVRNIQSGSQQALAEHVALEPIYGEAEGSRVTVEPGFDPAAVRLSGNVSGDPPFRGILRHRGWRAVQVDLPEVVQARGNVVAPAEVELDG